MNEPTLFSADEYMALANHFFEILHHIYGANPVVPLPDISAFDPVIWFEKQINALGKARVQAFEAAQIANRYLDHRNDAVASLAQTVKPISDALRAYDDGMNSFAPADPNLLNNEEFCIEAQAKVKEANECFTDQFRTILHLARFTNGKRLPF